MKNHLPNPEKYSQSYFQPTNPSKYKGTMPIRCLSSWEYKVCKMFDTHPGILYWASEGLAIPYVHPIKSLQRQQQVISKYYPDYIVVYVDKFGKQHKEIVEVKPSRQAFMEAAKSKKEKLDVIVNTAKWNAARQFCKQYGYSFRILTERDLYPGKK